jgi:ferritin-like metal-binding protein YciE
LRAGKVPVVAEPLTAPEELLTARLRTMLWIESMLAEHVLPDLLDSSSAVELTLAFERHLLETREHVEAVREILRELAVHAEPEESPVLRGLVTDHQGVLKRIDDEEPVLRDLAHAQAAAATEHLEMAEYESLASLAEALGYDEIGIRLRDLMEQEEFALEQVKRATTALLAEKVESERL